MISIDPIRTYSLIHGLFINREDAYLLQRTDGSYFKVDEPLDNLAIHQHKQGAITISIYQFNKENKVKWIAYDFDGKDVEEQEKKAKILYNKLVEVDGIKSIILESSGRKGCHIWVFCEPVAGEAAKRWAELADKDKLATEIFPKQETIGNGYGNALKLPLGIHKVTGNRCLLFDEKFNLLDLTESFEYLEKISKEPKFKIPISNTTTIEDKQKIIQIPTNNSKKMPYFIEQLINDGVIEGTRNKMIWLITKELYNQGFTEKEIIEQGLKFNSNCFPKEPESNIKKHVEYLLKNADKYLNRKVNHSYIG